MGIKAIVSSPSSTKSDVSTTSTEQKINSGANAPSKNPPPTPNVTTSKPPTPAPTNTAPSTPPPTPTPTNTSEITKASSEMKTEYCIPDRYEVLRAIKESDTIVHALEAVGAMYKIPSTCIECDTKRNSICFDNGKILAPAVGSPVHSAKEIICAIGQALDYISQRVNIKLSDMHMNNIEKGRLEDRVVTKSDPSKGKVIYYCMDDNGDDIIVYDSGLIDHAHTPESHCMIDMLRKQMMLPEFKCADNEIKGKTEPFCGGYFDEDEDIMEGVYECIKDELLVEYSVANEIRESEDVMNWMAHYNDTNHLGYHMLQEAGFDFVKKSDVEVMITESAKTPKKKKNKGSDISTSDLSHMKFDNRNIIAAINYFNDALAEQGCTNNFKDFDLNKFVNSKNYNKAIKSLEKQFDCHLNIHCLDTDIENAWTIPTYQRMLYGYGYNKELKQKLTISKSKGFIFNGLGIDITFTGEAIKKFTSPVVFGQCFTSIILHEIFHNVTYVMRLHTLQNDGCLSIAMGIASSQPDAKARRKVLTKYVDSLESFNGVKLNMITKRTVIKYLLMYSTLNDKNDIEAEIEAIKSDNNISEEKAKKKIDDLTNKCIRAYKRDLRRLKSNYRPNVAALAVLSAGLITRYVWKPKFISDPYISLWLTTITACAQHLFASSVAKGVINTITLKSFDKYENILNREEESADMFAAMYQLPVRWFSLPSTRYTPKDIKNDKLKELIEIEKDVSKYAMSIYPSAHERSYAAVVVAKKMLKEENLDVSVKKYLEWIVDNYSDLMKKNIGIKDNPSSVMFNPKDCEDLDNHLQDLIDAWGGEDYVDIQEQYTV